MAGAVWQEPGYGATGWYASSAPEQSNAVASGKGALASVRAQNKNAAVRYVFVYDGADASGTLIAGPIALAAHASVVVDFPLGVRFDDGLFVAVSDTDTSYHAASTDCWLNVAWRGL